MACRPSGSLISAMNSGSTNRCGGSSSLTRPASAWRLRRVARDAAKGVDRVLDALPRDPRTLILRDAVCSAVGVPAGVIAAVKRGGRLRSGADDSLVFGYSMPIFWWGLLLIMFVSVRLGWLPVSGRIDLIDYYFEQPTGFMTIDALLSDQHGRLPRRSAPPDIALNRARHGAARNHRAHYALLDA